MNNLQSPLAILNAALEHVPPQTRAILLQQGQEIVKALEKELQPPKE